MFERFTDRARRVVVLAQEEARLLNHNYIGTEHVLLGLIHEAEGVAAKVLVSLGVELQAARLQVDEIVGAGGTPPSGHIPFTPRAKKSLELALREALQLGHNYIGTEHLLLGLIREGSGVAVQVIVNLGTTPLATRQAVMEMLSSQTPREDETQTEEGSFRSLLRPPSELQVRMKVPLKTREGALQKYKLAVQLIETPPQTVVKFFQSLETSDEQSGIDVELGDAHHTLSWCNVMSHLGATESNPLLILRNMIREAIRLASDQWRQDQSPPP